MTQKLMTDREVAEYTGLSLWSINELRRRGEIPFVVLPTIRRFFYKKSSIDEWINDNLQKPQEVR